MAASALKMTAISCGAVLVAIILLSAAAQPAVAYLDGAKCPSAASPCALDCVSACKIVAPHMCSTLCTITPPYLGWVDEACVQYAFTQCQTTCKTLCGSSPINP